MAVTRLADIIVPELWVPYLREMTAENSRLFQSGILIDDENIDGELDGGGNSVHVPFWQDLGTDGTTDSAQGDDPTSDITPGKVDSDEQIAPVLRRVVSFGAADLASALAGDDPMGVVADRIAPFWSRRWNAAAIKAIQGALGALDAESPVANGYKDVAVASGTAVLLDADTVIDARQEGLGDVADELTLMFVHSKVFARLQKLNLIDFIPDARGEVMIPTYLGMQLVVSDTLPVDTSGSNNIYETYIAGPGALRYGETAAKVPAATQREELEADGAGVEYFVSRRDVVIHPLGFKYSGSIPSAGPANSALGTAGNWTRVFERKNVPLVGIKTNG